MGEAIENCKREFAEQLTQKFIHLSPHVLLKIKINDDVFTELDLLAFVFVDFKGYKGAPPECDCWERFISKRIGS